MSLINIVKAAENSVVTCSGGDCTICSILETVNKVYNFLTGLSFAVAVLFLALAGLVFIFGTGRKNYFVKAKNFAKNAIVGFVFVLVGWLSIHAVLYSTGYKNAGDWWQFQCSVDSSDYQAVSLKSVKAYGDLAAFSISGDSQGIIKKSVSDSVFQEQLNNLKTGEKLTFYMIGKKDDGKGGQEDVIVPFLAGYKNVDGTINVSALESGIWASLASMSDENKVSLMNSLGGLMTQEQTNSLTNRLFSSLLGVDPSNYTLNERIQLAREAAVSLRDQNSASGTASEVSGVAKVMNSMLESAIDQAGEVLVSKTNTADKAVSSTKDSSSSGDRSETTDKNGYDPDKWKNTQQQQNTTQNNQKNDKFTGSSDDFSKLIDQDKNKPEGETSLCDDDWSDKKGRMGILMGLRRLYRRDRLRYEMMFRFVDTVGDKPGGGECTGCGKIKVDHSAKIVDIAHILVHEGTHSGQFCLNLMGPYEAQGIGEGQPGRGKIEAIACANAMGAVEKNKGHQNMDEFTKGSDGKTAIENLPKVTLGAGSGQGGTGQIRGNLARYWTEVTLRGDLDTGTLDKLYDFMTKYPPSQGLPQNYYPAGNHHYGICEGSPKYLTLQDPEEEVVKKIVTSKEKCKSSPPKDVLPPCKPGSSGEDGKAAPLPQIEACKGAPEMQIQ